MIERVFVVVFVVVIFRVYASFIGGFVCVDLFILWWVCYDEFGCVWGDFCFSV